MRAIISFSILTLFLLAACQPAMDATSNTPQITGKTLVQTPSADYSNDTDTREQKTNPLARQPIKGPRLPATDDTTTYGLETKDLVDWELTSQGKTLLRSSGKNITIDFSELGDKDFQLFATHGQDTYNTMILPIPLKRIPPGTLLMGEDDIGKVGRGNGGLESPSQEEFRKGKLGDPAMYHDESPEHPVKIQPFEMAVYETTNKEYALFVNQEGHRAPRWHPDLDQKIKTRYARYLQNWTYTNGRWSPPKGWEDHPVTLVSKEDCAAFAKWAGYRLLTEPEWEWSASGPADLNYPWGEIYTGTETNIDFLKEDPKGPEPVGTRPKDISAFGIHDLGGNVMEWVSTNYTSYPGSKHPFTDSRYAVNRGGSWGYEGEDQYTHTRFVFPGGDDPMSRWHDIGCRLARDVTP